MDMQFLLGLGIDEPTAAVILETAASETDERLRTAGEGAEALRLRDKFGYALERSLEREGARNIRAARAALDYEWDGCDFEMYPVGLCDAVSKLKHDEPYLFFGGVSGIYETMPRCAFVGIVPVEPSDTDLDSDVTDGLSYSEYMRLYHSV